MFLTNLERDWEANPPQIPHQLRSHPPPTTSRITTPVLLSVRFYDDEMYTLKRSSRNRILNKLTLQAPVCQLEATTDAVTRIYKKVFPMQMAYGYDINFNGCSMKISVHSRTMYLQNVNWDLSLAVDGCVCCLNCV